MAVYKPTLCYPFLNSMDIRVAKYGDFQDFSTKYFQYLSCKIDNSNKKITGYKIKILTSDNQQVFPVDEEGNPIEGKISPIEELQIPELGFVENTASINSGLNGTTLRVPFFQNKVNPVLTSYNAVYYEPTYLADYILKDGLEDQSDLEYWTLNSSTGKIEYNWDKAGATPEEKKANEIKLDGEVILKGEIILIIGEVSVDGTTTTEDCTGLWVVDGEYNETDVSITTVLVKAMDFTDASSTGITLIKGATRHNYTYTINYDHSSTMSYTESVTGGIWYNISNIPISLLDSNKTSYKWEVTLYQGNYVPSQITTIPAEIFYSDVDPEWLDMTLTSGKIMGSTPERIQISDSDESHIPEGIDGAPIVLQERFMELSNNNTGIFSGGVRVRVKTYDSTYGHVYPMLDSLNTTNISNASYCQFFKYSSDPSQILNTDIVSYVYTSDITLTLIELLVDTAGTSKWGRSYTLTQEDKFKTEVELNKRHVVCKSALSPVIKDGDLVLLQGQSDPKTNGVYMVSKLTAVDESLEPSADATYFEFVRPEGYATWANYLGKIVYCTNGEGSRGINMQSLASSGGNLWNISSTSSGSSALYFVQERPILLFPNKLEPNRTFNLFETSINRPALNTEYTGQSIDGVSIATGDIILYKDGHWGTVSETSYDPNTNQYQYKLSNISGKYSTDETKVNNNEYVYILNGKTLGQLVFKYTNSSATYNPSTANWDLHTAKILKNSTTCTYISPWKDLQDNMKIELLNNKTITFSSAPAIPTRWIKINSHNNVVFSITHDALQSALISYNKTDTTIPWSYDVKYFFRTSDENPFYSYETPYLTLYKNDEFYSDLKVVGGTFYFYVRPNRSTPAVNEFILNNTQGDGMEFIITNYEVQAIITGRSVKLQAEYIGLGQSSWESYRWILYDENDQIVQDTGKRYDKDLSVTFFGLSNDTSENIMYKAVLLVENNFGDVVSYVIDLLVYPGSISSFLKDDGGKFTATFDCSTQSTIINFLESSAITEDVKTNTYLYSMYRREYEILDRPGQKIYCYYHDGQCYTTEEYTDIVTKNPDFVYIDQNTKDVYQYQSSNNIFVPTEAFRIYKGEWEPVLIADNRKTFRDFNISNHRSYQYIVYPSTSEVLEYGLDTTQQAFANFDGKVWISSDDFVYIQPTNKEGHLEHGTIDTSVATGEPITTKWQSWSITELIPEELDIDAPIIKKKYRVDNNNIWLFKYSLDTGSITQNISKEEFETLGRFSKYGFGDKNFVSGSVTALLGSELVLSSKVQYVERLGESRIKALTSNERALMSQQWQNFCYSKNPKLLKDVKGQSWIVQLISNTMTPDNFIMKNPETVSFEWKQVDTTNNIIIYGDYETKDVAIKQAVGSTEWKKVY